MEFLTLKKKKKNQYSLKVHWIFLIDPCINRVFYLNVKKGQAFFSTNGHMLKVAAFGSKKTPCVNAKSNYILFVQ